MTQSSVHVAPSHSIRYTGRTRERAQWAKETSIERDHQGHRGQAGPNYPASARHRDPATCGQSRRQDSHHSQGQAEGQAEAEGQGQASAQAEGQDQAEAAPVERSGEGGDRKTDEGVLGEAEEGQEIGVRARLGAWARVPRLRAGDEALEFVEPESKVTAVLRHVFAEMHRSVSVSVANRGTDFHKVSRAVGPFRQDRKTFPSSPCVRSNAPLSQACEILALGYGLS